LTKDLQKAYERYKIAAHIYLTSTGPSTKIHDTFKKKTTQFEDRRTYCTHLVTKHFRIAVEMELFRNMSDQMSRQKDVGYHQF